MGTAPRPRRPRTPRRPGGPVAGVPFPTDPYLTVTMPCIGPSATPTPQGRAPAPGLPPRAQRSTANQWARFALANLAASSVWIASLLWGIYDAHMLAINLLMAVTGFGAGWFLLSPPRPARPPRWHVTIDRLTGAGTVDFSDHLPVTAAPEPAAATMSAKVYRLRSKAPPQPFIPVCPCPSCGVMSLHWFAGPDRIPATAPPIPPILWRECADTGCRYVWQQLQ